MGPIVPVRHNWVTIPRQYWIPRSISLIFALVSVRPSMLYDWPFWTFLRALMYPRRISWASSNDMGSQAVKV